MTTKRTLLIRGLLAAFGFGLAASQSLAGDIIGNVTDASGRGNLPGAGVSIVENGRSETADKGGNFRFSGLGAGDYTLHVTYAGYEAKNQTVSVPAQGDAPVTIAMGEDVVKLEKYVVEGYREGRSRALQQKRNATNISDLVSADAIGRLPDRNVAEAVARLPGVNMSLSQGEGRYVSIRGSEPNLNQVMMDGATMAAPGGSRLGRAVPLDTLGAGQVSQVEVIKSVTPDLDANAIGGTVNIISRSAFDHKGQFLAGSVAGIKNGNTDNINFGAQGTYSNTFGTNNEWGLAASANYERRSYSNEWLQFGWSPVVINGATIYIPNDFEIKPEHGDLTRYGANLNLEFRPDPNTLFYLRPGLSKTTNPEERFEIIYTASPSPTTVTMTSATAGTINSGTRTERRNFRQKDDQSLFNLAGGFKKTIGNFTLEPMATFSHAKQENPYTNDREFRDGNNQSGPFGFDLGTGFVPLAWNVDPAIDVPSKYSLRRTRDDFGTVDEEIYTGKTDLTWKTDNIAGNSGFFKAGFKYLQRKRVVDLESRRLVPVGNWNLAQTGTQLPSVPVYGGRFQSLFLPDSDAINVFIAANPALVTHDPVAESANSIEDDYQIAEYIYSGYAMGSVDLKKLTLLAGVRWEKTDATIRAVEERTVNNVLIARFPTSGTTSYDKFFPNVQGVYHFTDQLLLRAAFTQTIGRPAYEDARELALLNYTSIPSPLDPNFPNTGSVTVGNPQLKPYGSKNYDLSLEWYAKKGGGVITVAAFRKDISDPIYTFNSQQTNVVYRGVGFSTLSFTGKLNGTSGRISGVEFNVYQPFSFLPSPFDGFGIEANYTTISSSEKITLRPNEDIPFFRQPDKIANVTLFYEKYKFSARVAYSYAGEQIYTLGTLLPPGNNLLQDRYETPRKQIDAQLSYRLTQHFSLTASVRNLTREPDEMSYGIKNLVQMSRLLDRDYRVSVDFNF